MKNCEEKKMSIEQIINKAKKIRGENSLEILKGEKEILEKLNEIEENKDFYMGSTLVTPFSISHDAAQPVAYRFDSDGKSMAVATDMGMYDDYIIGNLKGLDAVLIESNHDINMLQIGPYPYALKRRIWGNKGHLSNETCGNLLNEIISDRLKNVILGHLSKENNFPENPDSTDCAALRFSAR